MSYKELALNFDAQQKPIESVWAYEIAISAVDADLGLFNNLAVLYFVCRDYGFASHHQLLEDFFLTTLQRSFEILQLAETKFGNQTEILFWREYFSFIYAENSNIDSICLSLARRDDSLLPFMYLAGNSDKKEYKEKAQILFESVKQGATERERYIKSILESKQ